MKFVSRTPKLMAVPYQIHTYTELRQQIHNDLRSQHPEWIEPNGESPMCDSYDARLMELLRAATLLSIFRKISKIETWIRGKTSVKFCVMYLFSFLILRFFLLLRLDKMQDENEDSVATTNKSEVV